MFSPEQEVELGRVVGLTLEASHRVIRDPALTGYLELLGKRLDATLPPPGTEVRFALIDLPFANAYAVIGGTVYVSRKMASVLRSEDELAALLAHEMAHLVTREAAVSMTRQFRKELRLDRVETGELFERWNELIEKRRARSESGEEPESGEWDAEQEQADRVGLEMLRAAGYKVEAMAAWLDRAAGLRGRRGSFLTDLAGSTLPEAKRLRALEERTRANACRPASPAAPSDAFTQWQQAVLRYKGIGHAEVLPGLVRRGRLQPALRADLARLRFSPDGRYVLAQDDSTIAIFTGDTLAPVFEIEAQGARPASFSPDSRRISFFVSPPFGSPRVEHWTISDRSNEIHDIHVARGCAQSALAPDGSTFVCLPQAENDAGALTLDLQLIDVETEQVFLERKSFITTTEHDTLVGLVSGLAAGEVEVFQVAFSPDGKYLLLGREDLTAAFDLKARQPVSLDGRVKRLMRSSFAFMDPARLLGTIENDLQIVSFPDGRPILERLPVGTTTVTPVTKGEYLILGPLKGAAAGILNLADKSIPLVLSRRTADVHDQLCVREREDGRLALHQLPDGKEVANTPMVETELRALSAATMSPDLRWVALSGRTRGAVWDLVNEKRVLYLRGFQAAWLGEKDAMHAAIRETANSSWSLVRFDLAAPPAVRARDGVRGARWSLEGRYLLTLKPARSDRRLRDVTMEVRDVSTDGVLWSRLFPYEPSSRLLDSQSGFLVLTWPLSEAGPRKAVTEDPAWQVALRGVKDRSNAVCFEVVDASSGQVRARMALDGVTTVFSHARAVATADRLIVLESGGSWRLLTYSFDGKLQGRAIARSFVVSPDGHRLASVTADGRLVVFDTATLAPQRTFHFLTHPVVAGFSADGSRLLVVGSDQTTYLIQLQP
jgi:WD40 repeat protein